MPVMATRGVGYGVGKKEFDRANCVRAFWGETADAANGEIAELVCNMDDMTPEALSYACARLLEEGALDVYATPGVMKKGRPRPCDYGAVRPGPGGASGQGRTP